VPHHVRPHYAVVTDVISLSIFNGTEVDYWNSSIGRKIAGTEERYGNAEYKEVQAELLTNEASKPS